VQRTGKIIEVSLFSLFYIYNVEHMWKVFLLSAILIGIAIAAIAIKMFVKKDGEFKKTCSTIDPETGESLGCTCGKGDGGAKCENKS